jgi:predicted MFS family arabinose efflux permease
MNYTQAPTQVPRESISGTQEKLLFFILAVIQFTHIMDFMIMVPLGPQLIDIFNISTAQFSFLVSAYTFSAGVSGFASAFFIDRFDRKYALLALYAGFTLGTFACALSPNYYFLLIARTLTGVFGGVIGALVYAIIGDAVPVEKRGKAMGVIMSSFAVASVAGVPFGLFLADRLNWHAPFFLLAFLSGVFLLFSMRILPNMRKHMENQQRRSPKMIITQIINSRNQLWALSLMIMLMLGAFSIIPLLSTYMVKNVGFSQSQLAYIYLTGGSVSFFSSIIVGNLADKFGKARVFIIAALLSTIPVITITNLGVTPVPIALCIFAFFFIFMNARLVPAMAIITSSVPSQQRGSFMSINSSVQSVSSGIAAFLAGMVVHESAVTGQLVNYNWVGVFSVFAVLSCIIFVRKIKPVMENPKTTPS